MRILVACEFSGVVRDAFAKRGHDAWSCDLLPTESMQPVVFASDLPMCETCGEEPWCDQHLAHFGDCACIGPTQDGVAYSADGLRGAKHIEGDVLPILGDGWGMLIAFPPCTYLCSSGLHWNKRRPERATKTEEALAFARALLEAPIARIALENPVGCISTRIRRPDQTIHPWQYGHPESKQTCLWLKGLPLLVPTNIVEAPGVQAGGRPRWANQTPTGQNKLGPSPDRWKLRSVTYAGIAEAMAEQWGDYQRSATIESCAKPTTED